MPDKIDAWLQARTFPGSTKVIPETPVPPVLVEGEPDWVLQNKPRVLTVGGVPTEFFHIGALADALGRSTSTIRRWIDEGTLPDAKYRSRSTNEKKRKRLWKREQIEIILRLAHRHGLMNTKTLHTQGIPAQFREDINKEMA